MPFYRIDVGERASSWAHFNFGRNPKNTPHCCAAPCFDFDDSARFGGRCARVATTLCDAPLAHTWRGTPLTCDAPMCERHRTRGGENVDYCPRHRHLAPATPG